MATLGIDFTTAQLINEIKVRQTVPTSQGLMSDADFVLLLNAAMHQKLIPAIHKVKEDYFIKSSDTAIVANQNNYDLPIRAVGGQLRHWCLVDENGVETELPRIDIAAPSRPIPLYGARFQNNQVILIPTPTSTGQSVRFYFERRPNNLVTTSLAGKIASIDTGANTIDVVSIPSTWAVGTYIDFISGEPMFESVGDAYPITAISGLTVTFGGGLPSGLAVDDYAAQSGFTPIPQLPYEGHLVMAQYAAAWTMRSLSNKRPMQDAEKAADGMLASFLNVINPRVDSEPKRFTNTGGGVFNANAGQTRGWRLNVGP